MTLAAVLTVKNDKPYRHILHYNAFSCHDEAEQQRQFEKLSDASRSMKILQVGKHGQFILRNLLMPIMQSK